MDYKELKTSNINGVYREALVFEKSPSLGDLARSMQKVTEHAMEDMGIHFKDLRERHLLWMLCFSQIDICRIPKAGEETEMFSWPGAGRMGMPSRRYALFSSEGEMLFNCTTLFSFVDETARTMVLPEKTGFEYPVLSFPGEPGNPKLNEKGPEPVHSYSHQVERYEIDYNDHVNNAFYFDWMEPVVIEFTHNGTIPLKRVWISYSKEVRYGDTAEIRYAADGDILFARGYVNGEYCFIIKMQK